MCGDIAASDFLLFLSAILIVEVLCCGLRNCTVMKERDKKEASQAEDIACGPFCVSPRVPGFCLSFPPAVLGLSPGAGGQGAAVENRPCELEAKAALLAETCRSEKAGGPLCM